ncbi:hypothetical protein ACS0TY_030858 [Phlomoides rotata]
MEILGFMTFSVGMFLCERDGDEAVIIFSGPPRHCDGSENKICDFALAFVFCN